MSSNTMPENRARNLDSFSVNLCRLLRARIVYEPASPLVWRPVYYRGGSGDELPPRVLVLPCPLFARVDDLLPKRFGQEHFHFRYELLFLGRPGTVQTLRVFWLFGIPRAVPDGYLAIGRDGWRGLVLPRARSAADPRGFARWRTSYSARPGRPRSG